MMCFGRKILAVEAAIDLSIVNKKIDTVISIALIRRHLDDEENV